MNVIARLEYELAYYDSAVHRFNHYTTRTPIVLTITPRGHPVVGKVLCDPGTVVWAAVNSTLSQTFFVPYLLVVLSFLRSLETAMILLFLEIYERVCKHVMLARFQYETICLSNNSSAGWHLYFLFLHIMTLGSFPGSYITQLLFRAHWLSG